MAAIEKRGKNSYRLTVSCGYDKSGKKIRKYKTINLSDIKPNKQLEEAQRQFVLFQNEIEKGLYLDAGKITFEDFIHKWLKDYAENELAPKTFFSYKKILESRIIPALGHIKLNKLQPTHLNEFYNNLRENGIRLDKKYTPNKNFDKIISESRITLKDIASKAGIQYRTIKGIKTGKNFTLSTATKISEVLGVNIDTIFNTVEKTGPLSERTILYHHRIISSILTSAVQWQFILNNPASRVKPPKVERKEARHFEIDQVEYILQLVEYEPIKYKTMVYLCIYGGMRAGELNGLEWSDLDWDNEVLRIRQASQYLPDRGIFTKSTKNMSSDRVIALPDTVMAVMRQYKLWQNGVKADLGNLWVDSNRIFTKRNGAPIFPQTLGKWFSKFIKRHNNRVLNDSSIPKKDKKKYLLDNVNFHGLRHTSASLLIGQGMDVATVSKRLGHAEPYTTLKIYTHALQRADREAANKLENLFNKPEKGKKQG
ncbi:tyrosine-type recombinase/integrase [Clostridium sp. HV4-5-A1G]|uniref:tyrosine-type recombinase/integrase n=1 Tax=Clostridium sp. HV4-5-A1G TaxID=2004595 RepID=UPI001681FF7A|nr:tyrosine-type recombinase/integrase [Clostridium sp. HV4-5-A1G]